MNGRAYLVERSLRPLYTSPVEDDPCTHLCQLKGGLFPYAVSCAGYENRFVVKPFHVFLSSVVGFAFQAIMGYIACADTNYPTEIC